MDLKTYLGALPPDSRDPFAVACGTTRGHMQNVMYGFRPCSPELAVQIERATSQAVRRWDLRPEDWHRIWPELVGADGAPALPAEQEG